MTGTDIGYAAGLLRQGKLVSVPTETVYGLAANALNENAVLEIFKAKNRPFFDPLIVHIPGLTSASPYVISIPEKAVKLAEKFWPGPLTLLLYKSDIIPDIVTSGSSKVALRVPDHQLTLSLLKELDFPLAAPSANPFGYISPTRAEHVIQQLGGRVDYILDGGECSVGLESTIADCTGAEVRILRLGGLSITEIEECLGEKVLHSLSEGSNPSAPGQLDRHYSPGTRFILTEDPETTLLLHRSERCAFLAFGQINVIEGVYTLNLSPSGNLDEAARNLFHYMRLLDDMSPDVIIAGKVPDFGLGAAINDRLKRASFA